MWKRIIYFTAAVAGLAAAILAIGTTISDASEDPGWDALVDRFSHDSHSQMFRNCYIERGLCEMGYFMQFSDQTKLQLQVMMDSNGRVIRRYICLANPFGDQTNCFNWVTGEGECAMLDSRFRDRSFTRIPCANSQRERGEADAYLDVILNGFTPRQTFPAQRSYPRVEYR